MNDGFVTVPPGHKVVVIHPSTQPQLNHLDSNFLVLDFGIDGNWRTLISGFDVKLGRTEVPPTLVILQGAMLDRLRASGELWDFVSEWQRLRERGWQAVWVLPREAAGQVDAVELPQMAGFGVHGSAEDGACFIEVHKPDGTITIGMTGPSLRLARDPDTLINDIANHQREEDYAEFFQFLPSLRLFLPFTFRPRLTSCADTKFKCPPDQTSMHAQQQSRVRSACSPSRLGRIQTLGPTTLRWRGTTYCKWY